MLGLSCLMRSCSAAVALGSVLAVVVFTGGASAQTYLSEKITFTGSTCSQEELLAFTGLRAGESLTRDQMQAASDKLTATGLFTDVRFTFDGETLTFALKPSAAVVPAEYDNFPWWDNAGLNAAVAGRVPLFHGALYPGGPMRAEVSAALTALLAAKGVRAAITTSPVGDADGNQVAILYHIDAPPVVVEAFHVYGYSGIWTRPIEEVEKAAAGEKVDVSTRDKLGDAVRAAYGRLGFVDMTMTAPAWGQPRVEGEKILVPITASITSEGGQYRVAGLHLNGDVFTTQDEFEKRAKLHPGDVANQELWKQIEETIAAPYRTHGYIHAKIAAAPTLDRAAHTVDYTITVDPGPVYRMGKLTVVNLSDKQKAEVLPYWLMKPGDVFNPELIPKFVENYHKSRAPELQSVGGWNFDAKWYENTDTHTMDVVLTFEPPKSSQ